ncbi:proline dehydrogenase [Tilletia horrida]|nr:proline dehydrogenase [Tilletia horrida]
MIGIGIGGAGILGLVSTLTPLHADSQEASRLDPDWEDEDIPTGAETKKPLSHLPLSALLRSYVVYTLCRFPWLVDAGPALIDWTESTSLPFVSTISNWIFRKTFFDQFVGGETAEECIPVIQGLDKMGLGTIFVYSVEFKEKGKAKSSHNGKSPDASALQQTILDEIVHSVEVGSAASSAHSHEVMVAIKLSGLLKDPHILERASAAIVPRELFSRGPPVPTPPQPHTRANTPHGALSIPLAALPASEQAALRELWQALRRVTLCAKEKGNVRLLIDAEYSFFQPAIDAMYEALAAEFNSLSDKDVNRRGPLVFNTFQAYLRRTPSFLTMSLERARAHGYALGAKLVRGAYVELENKVWKQTAVDSPPTADPKTEAERANEAWGSPVWPSKRHSDECYDACARVLVDEVANDLRAEQKARRSGSSEEEARKFRRTAVVFASHNLQSGLKAIRRMLDQDLVRHEIPVEASVKGQTSKPALHNLLIDENLANRIAFGQLFGMADTVSARLLASFANDGLPSNHSPDPAGRQNGVKVASGTEQVPASCIVYKYLPYGSVELVMPYLIRRATENKSVVGGGAAAKELSAVWTELMRRIGL